MSAHAVRRSALVLAGVLVGAAVIGEAWLRLSYFGVTRAALGAWRRPPPWSTIRTLDADGTPWPRPHGQARWALQPSSSEIEYRTDGRGFRVGAEAGLAPEIGACRVLVAGDSNAFGYGVAAEDTVPAQLGRALERGGIAAETANAGVCGSTVDAQHSWLERIVPLTAPHVVVLLVSPWSLRVDRHPPPRRSTVADRVWGVLEQPVKRVSSVSSLVDRSHRRVAHALHQAVGWPLGDTVSWELEPLLDAHDAFAERFAAAAVEIRRIAQLARRNGASLLLAFVPLDLQVSSQRNRLYREERLPYPSFGFEDRDYTTDERYAVVEDLAREIGAPYVDATSSLRTAAAEAFLVDDYHLSPTGNTLLADAVAPLVAHTCVRVAAEDSLEGGSREGPLPDELDRAGALHARRARVDEQAAAR